MTDSPGRSPAFFKNTWPSVPVSSERVRNKVKDQSVPNQHTSADERDMSVIPTPIRKAPVVPGNPMSSGRQFNIRSSRLYGGLQPAPPLDYDGDNNTPQKVQPGASKQVEQLPDLHDLGSHPDTIAKYLQMLKQELTMLRYEQMHYQTVLKQRDNELAQSKRDKDELTRQLEMERTKYQQLVQEQAQVLQDQLTAESGKSKRLEDMVAKLSAHMEESAREKNTQQATLNEIRNNISALSPMASPAVQQNLGNYQQQQQPQQQQQQQQQPAQQPASGGVGFQMPQPGTASPATPQFSSPLGNAVANAMSQQRQQQMQGQMASPLNPQQPAQQQQQQQFTPEANRVQQYGGLVHSNSFVAQPETPNPLVQQQLQGQMQNDPMSPQQQQQQQQPAGSKPTMTEQLLLLMRKRDENEAQTQLQPRQKAVQKKWLGLVRKNTEKRLQGQGSPMMSPGAGGSPAIVGEEKAIAQYNFLPTAAGEISLTKGETIRVVEKRQSGWWIGINESGAAGEFPGNYVKLGLNTPLVEQQQPGGAPGGPGQQPLQQIMSPSVEEPVPQGVEPQFAKLFASVDLLRKGMVFTKHQLRGKPHSRRVWLTRDAERLMWAVSGRKNYPETGKDYVLLRSIVDIVPGYTTQAFKRSGRAGNEKLAFSVITAIRSLDLEGNSETTVTQFIEALRHVMSKYQMVKQIVAIDQKPV